MIDPNHPLFILPQSLIWALSGCGGDRGCLPKWGPGNTSASAEIGCLIASPPPHPFRQLLIILKCLNCSKLRANVRKRAMPNETFSGVILVDIFPLFPLKCCLYSSSHPAIFKNQATSTELRCSDFPYAQKITKIKKRSLLYLNRVFS